VSRRLPAFGMLAIGIAVLVVLFSTNLFAIGAAFEELTDGFRPIMTDENLSAAGNDVVLLGAVSTEFAVDVSPELASRLNISSDEFDVYLATTFPSVVAGLSAIPEVMPRLAAVVDLLDRQQQNFASADAIPTGFLPVTTVPWMILLIGIATIFFAILMLGATERAWLITTAFGVVVVSLTLLLSLLPKARAADDLNAALTPAYNQELISTSAQALGVVGTMGREMQDALLPDLMSRLNMDQTGMAELLAEFPATEAALSQLGGAMDRFQTMVTAFDGQLDNYNVVKETSLAPVAVVIVSIGLLIIVCGVWGFVVVNRRAPAPA